MAMYFSDGELGSENCVDHGALLQSVVVDASTGNWEKVEEGTKEGRHRLTGKTVGYFETPPQRRA